MKLIMFNREHNSLFVPVGWPAIPVRLGLRTYQRLPVLNLGHSQANWNNWLPYGPAISCQGFFFFSFSLGTILHGVRVKFSPVIGIYTCRHTHSNMHMHTSTTHTNIYKGIHVNTNKQIHMHYIHYAYTYTRIYISQIPCTYKCI